MSYGDNGDRHERVYRIVLEHPGMDAEAVARHAQITLRAARQSLRRCHERGIIIGLGPRHRMTYVPAEHVGPVAFGRGQSAGSHASRPCPFKGKPLRRHTVTKTGGNVPALPSLAALLMP